MKTIEIITQIQQGGDLQKHHYYAMNNNKIFRMVFKTNEIITQIQKLSQGVTLLSFLSKNGFKNFVEMMECGESGEDASVNANRILRNWGCNMDRRPQAGGPYCTPNFEE